jgi:predicted GNAT family acetyltransferase
MRVTVREDPARSRYEIYDGDALAGFCDYKLTGERIALLHTETKPEFAGRGMARRLVTEMLDDVRERGLEVLPFCPYVRQFILEHPADLDLVPEDQRTRFDLPHSTSR